MTVEECKDKIRETEDQLTELYTQLDIALGKEMEYNGERFLEDYEHKYYYCIIPYEHSTGKVDIVHIQSTTIRPSGAKVLNATLYESAYMKCEDGTEDYHFTQCARDLMYGDLKDIYKYDEYLTPSEFNNWKTQAELSVIMRKPPITIDEVKNGVKA